MHYTSICLKSPEANKCKYILKFQNVFSDLRKYLHMILKKLKKAESRNFLQSVLGLLNTRMISRNEIISVWKNLTDPSFYMCQYKYQIIGMYHLPSNMKSVNVCLPNICDGTRTLRDIGQTRWPQNASNFSKLAFQIAELFWESWWVSFK